MRAEGREYLKRVGPLLLGGAVACTAAAAALSNAVDEPAFEVTLHVMIFVGVTISALLGSLGRSATALGVVVIAVAVAGVAQRLGPVPFLDVMYPPEIATDEDLTWATLVAWSMVGFCFMLSRRHNILFAVVSGLAIFGLVGTVNLNTAMLIAFAVFVFAVVFVWGYEHLLNVGESLPHTREGGRDWLRIARTQALAGTMLVVLLLTVAMAVGSALYAVGPRLFVGPEGMVRYARWLQVSLLSYGGTLDKFYVGQGPVHLPATPAIKVQADRPALWRGAVFDHYSGRGWSREVTTTAELERDADGWYVVPGAGDAAGERNRQIVTILSNQPHAIYAAAQPVRARMTEEAMGRARLRYRPALDFYGTLRTSFTQMPGVEWEVISVMPPTDPATLRATSTNYPPRIVRRYIEQMEVQAEAELGPIVAQVTAGAETPYDKVAAIREFLSTTCLYTTRAPAVPGGEDAAAYFVTSGRRGACDLFATSLAVMCRLAGVPARIATGYQIGEYDDTEGAYIARVRDAHAWAEVYFPEVGWVPFDVAAAEADAGSDLLDLLRGPWRIRVNRLLAGVWRVVVVIAIGLALISAVVGPSVAVRWLRRRVRMKNSRERMGEAFEWFRRRAGRLAGVGAERWRTPAEVRDALADVGLATSGRVRHRFEDFIDRFYALRYGRVEPAEEDVRATRAAARRLLEDLRRDLRTLRRRTRRGR